MGRKIEACKTANGIAAWIGLAAVLALAAPAQALIAVEGLTSATFHWEPAAGPVEGYHIIVSIDGAPFWYWGAVPGQNSVVIDGEIDEVVKIAVVAYDATGKIGPLSETSEPIRFAAASPPPDTGEPPPDTDEPPPDTDEPPPVTNPVAGAPFDFDGDGRSDLLVRNDVSSAAELWSMDAQGVAAVSSFAAAGRSVAMVGNGDYNGDGIADILWRDPSSGGVSVSYMDGSAVVGSAVLNPGLSDNYVVAGSGDYNGDDISDVLIYKAAENKFKVWLMLADGSYDTGSILKEFFPETATIIASGDFDGDGLADILWRGGKSGDVDVWGLTGALTHGDLEGAESTWVIIGAGDFDGDGRDDLLLRKRSNDRLAVRLSTRAMRDKITSELNEKFADQQVLAIGDYNGDGRMDLVVYNGREDVIRVWYLNGYTLEHAETVEDPGNAWYFASVDGRTPGSH